VEAECVLWKFSNDCKFRLIVERCRYLLNPACRHIQNPFFFSYFYLYVFYVQSMICNKNAEMGHQNCRPGIKPRGTTSKTNDVTFFTLRQ